MTNSGMDYILFLVALLTAIFYVPHDDDDELLLIANAFPMRSLVCYLFLSFSVILIWTSKWSGIGCIAIIPGVLSHRLYGLRLAG